MTTNQIRYQEHLEQKRHNVATETEASRANKAKEDIQRDYNVWFSGETTRHNLAQEEQARQTLIVNDNHYQRQDAEQTRHNVAAEQLQAQAQSEIGRHNAATEQLQAQAQSEAGRHNRATENETARHNSVAEAQTWHELTQLRLEVLSKMKQAEASMITAQANQSRAETESKLADHKRRLESAEFAREAQWHTDQLNIDQQKADAATTQAKASLKQADVANWNSISQTTTAQYQRENLAAQTSLANAQAKLTDAKTHQVAVNTNLGIFDTVRSTVKDVLNVFKKRKGKRK